MKGVTTIEQSRYLAGILDPSTADMHYTWVWDSVVENRKKWILQVGAPQREDDKPAWSLDALVELMCYDHRVDVIFCRTTSRQWACYWKRSIKGFQTVLSRVGKTKVEAAFIALSDLINCGEIETWNEKNKKKH